MAYASASNVAPYCLNILGDSTNFTDSTMPTIKQVNGWLSSGCAVINAKILGMGYGIPASGTTIFEALTDCNALFAAARVEMARTNVTLAPGERTRGQIFEEMARACACSVLGAGDLTLVGLTKTSSGKLYVGGVSVTQKQTEESDTDRVTPRFNRGEFDFPGTIQPKGSNTAS